MTALFEGYPVVCLPRRSILKFGSYDTVVGGAIVFVVILVEVIVANIHSFEGPEAFAGVVVKFLRDENMVKGFLDVLMNMRVVNVSFAAKGLQATRRIEIGIAAALVETTQYVIGLTGYDVQGIASVSVVQVAQNDHRCV